MMITRALGCFLLALFVAALAPPAKSAETPKPGNPERKAILDALRVPVAKEIGIPVIFRVNHLKMQDDWAFFKGQLRTKGDGAIDYSTTPLAENARTADNYLVAVLKNIDDRWHVVQHSIFTTDVWWHGIHERLGAPIAIFDYAGS